MGYVPNPFVEHDTVEEDSHSIRSIDDERVVSTLQWRQEAGPSNRELRAVHPRHVVGVARPVPRQPGICREGVRIRLVSPPAPDAAVDSTNETVALRIIADELVGVGRYVRVRSVLGTPSKLMISRISPGPLIARPDKVEGGPLRPYVLVVGIQIDASPPRLAAHVEVLPHRARTRAESGIGRRRM